MVTAISASTGLRRNVHEPEHGERQGHAVPRVKAVMVHRTAAAHRDQQDEPEHEEQVIGAAQNVLEAQCEVAAQHIERTGRSGIVTAGCRRAGRL